VDDSHRRGEAFTQVVKNLKKIGFKEVYKVIGETAKLINGDDYYR
jgi:glutamine phosphoribosylpyrophosphate amidotransferase